MLTMEKLESYGANPEAGVARCMNMEAFYLGLVGKVLEDPNIKRLCRAMEEGNAREAFEAAHALKGVAGNLSLTPIYTPAAELTELLRGAQAIPDTGDLLPRVLRALDDLRALID